MNASLESRLIKYIASVKWQVAKTMKQWPHAYTIKKWNPDKLPMFALFLKAIEEHGYEKRFLNQNWKYLDIGEYCYWADGWTSELTIINRALKSDSEKLWAAEEAKKTKKGKKAWHGSMAR